MARPEALSDKNKDEVSKLLANGQSMRSIAKQFGVSEGVIRKCVNTQFNPIKEVANQIATAELAYEKFPVKTQVKIRILADDLKDISHHLASAAKFGAITSHRLLAIANSQVDKIDEVDPLLTEDVMKGVAVLTKIANESSVIGINLINANKEQIKQINAVDDIQTLTLDEFYAQIGK